MSFKIQPFVRGPAISLWVVTTHRFLHIRKDYLAYSYPPGLNDAITDTDNAAFVYSLGITREGLDAKTFDTRLVFRSLLSCVYFCHVALCVTGLGCFFRTKYNCFLIIIITSWCLTQSRMHLPTFNWIWFLIWVHCPALPHYSIWVHSSAPSLYISHMHKHHGQTSTKPLTKPSNPI